MRSYNKAREGKEKMAMSTRAGRDSNYMPIRLFKKLAVKRSGLHVIAAVLSSESLSATERRKSKLRYGPTDTLCIDPRSLRLPLPKAFHLTYFFLSPPLA